MRLLKLSDNGRFSLTKFADDKIPPYAILSHTWARGDMEEEEVTFKDNMDAHQRPSYEERLRKAKVLCYQSVAEKCFLLYK
jgi:hypothetical protein